MQGRQLENKTICNKGLIGLDSCSVRLEPKTQPEMGMASPGPGTLVNNTDLSP